jgi:hypothetical protein
LLDVKCQVVVHFHLWGHAGVCHEPGRESNHV